MSQFLKGKILINYLPIFILAFGAIMGSFLNVLIYRLPLEISIIFPLSSCPSCKKSISWYENIPIFSYLLLKGRCSKCKEVISLRYPFVELLSSIGTFFIISEYLYNPIYSIFYCIIFYIFIIIIFIDLKHKIIPDSLNIILSIIFIIASLFENSWLFTILGGLVGLSFPLGITWLYYLIRKQEGLGGGDIKLFCALGFYLGVQGIVMNIFISCFLGTIFSILMIIFKRVSAKEYIPFGPYIVITASLQIFFPEYINLLTSLLLF